MRRLSMGFIHGFILLAIIFYSQSAFAGVASSLSALEIQAQVRFLGYNTGKFSGEVKSVIAEIVNLSQTTNTLIQGPHHCPTGDEYQAMLSFLRKNSKQLTLQVMCGNDNKAALAFLAKHNSDPVKAGVLLRVFLSKVTGRIFVALITHSIPNPAVCPFPQPRR